MSTLKEVAQEAGILLRAGYPVLYLYSFEEDRVQAMWDALGKGLKREVFVWTRTEGFVGGDPKNPGSLAAICELASGTTPALFLFKDFHPYLSDPLVIRALRSALPAMKKNKRSLALVAPTLVIPHEL